LKENGLVIENSTLSQTGLSFTVSNLALWFWFAPAPIPISSNPEACYLVVKFLDRDSCGLFFLHQCFFTHFRQSFKQRSKFRVVDLSVTPYVCHELRYLHRVAEQWDKFDQRFYEVLRLL
jgi:hypothetical protein